MSWLRISIYIANILLFYSVFTQKICCFNCVVKSKVSMRSCRQEYCSGLPGFSLGDPPNPGPKPGSAALRAACTPPEPPGAGQLGESATEEVWPRSLLAVTICLKNGEAFLHLADGNGKTLRRQVDFQACFCWMVTRVITGIHNFCCYHIPHLSTASLADDYDFVIFHNYNSLLGR